MKKISISISLFIIIIPFLSFAQESDFNKEELDTLIFSKSISAIDSYLKTKNYVYKPLEKKEDSDERYIYFENRNRKMYADCIYIKEEPNIIDTTYSIMIVKSNDILFEKLKKEITGNPLVKKMKEKINKSSSMISYREGFQEYNFYIMISNGHITYTVEVIYKPSLEYFSK